MFLSLTVADEIKWSNEQLFQGVLVVEAKLPSEYKKLFPRYGTTDRRQLPRELPQRMVIPVINGRLLNHRLMKGDDLSPPNTRFTTTWYDSEGKKIGDTSALFELDDDFTLTVPTLTAPEAPTA